MLGRKSVIYKCQRLKSITHLLLERPSFNCRSGQIFHVGKNPPTEVSVYLPPLIPLWRGKERKEINKESKYHPPPVNNTLQLGRSLSWCALSVRIPQSVFVSLIRRIERVSVCVCLLLWHQSQVYSVVSPSQLSGIEKVGTLVCLPLVPLLRLGVPQAHLKACVCVCVCKMCDTPRDWPPVCGQNGSKCHTI